MNLRKAYEILFIFVGVLFLALFVFFALFLPQNNSSHTISGVLFGICALSGIAAFIFVLHASRNSFKKKIATAGFIRDTDWSWGLDYPISETRSAGIINTYSSHEYPHMRLVHYEVEAVKFIGCEYRVADTEVAVELYPRGLKNEVRMPDKRKSESDGELADLHAVQLESVEFNNSFSIYAKKEVDAYHFFDTDTMADLLSVEARLPKPFYIQVQGEHILISYGEARLVELLDSTYSVQSFIQDMQTVFSTLDRHIELRK